MFGDRQSNHNGRNKHNKDSDEIYTKQLRGGEHPVDFHVTSDISKKLLEKETWKMKAETTRKPSMQVSSAHVDILDTTSVFDTYDRPGNTSTEGTYAGCTKYAVAGFEDEPMKRLPKAVAVCEAGVGRARAELSVLEAEAKGPNASIGAEASVVGVGAMARAEVGSVSVKAGPVGVKAGLGVDTGASVGLGGVEAKVLGSGFSIGPKTSASVLGSEVSCSVM